MARKREQKCPNCGSEKVKILSLPISEEEEFIYCDDCKKVSVLTKVKIDDKTSNS